MFRTRLVYFVDLLLETLQFLNESADGHVPGSIYVHSQEGRPIGGMPSYFGPEVARFDARLNAGFTQPRAKALLKHVSSITVLRKLPAIAEENPVGIEHWEDDELDVLAQLLGDHVVAGQKLQHTFRDQIIQIRLSC